MSRLKQIGAWIWYPWLAGLFPVVFLYANNYTKVFGDDLPLVCLAVVIVVGLLVGLFWLIVRDAHKAAAMSLALIIPFFGYGPLSDQLIGGGKGPLADFPLLPVLLAVGVLAALAIGIRARGEGLAKATPNLNILTAGLVVFNLVTLVSAEVQNTSRARARSDTAASEVRASKIEDDSRHPDVYYIVLDAYPSNSSLMAESSIDNTAFTDELTRRGFFVAYDSTSNYPQTLPSLSSTLNMRYLTPHEGPPGNAGVAYARGLIADSEVSRQFLAMGYTYVFMLSGFDTASATADFNVEVMNHQAVYFPRSGPLPADTYRISFWPVVLDTTMLAPLNLADSLPLQPDYRPDSWRSAERVLALLDETPRIAQNPMATFAEIHVVVPHEPIRFSRTGEILKGGDLAAAKYGNRRKAFADQLNWLNDRVLQLVDDIISHSDTPPIIIIQGDHGSALGSPLDNGVPHYYHILNAYYFHGPGKNAALTSDVTPVNSFRILFNTYFQGSYDLLAPRHFGLPEQYTDPFDLTEVTVK